MVSKPASTALNEASTNLLVRISAVDYVDTPDGWVLENSIALAKLLKDKGVDLVTASGGGFTNVSKDKVYPGYQVPYSTAIKEQIGIATGAVGMITTAEQANEIIVNGQADLVVIARQHLRDPYFALHSAVELGVDVEAPWQYKRAF